MSWSPIPKSLLQVCVFTTFVITAESYSCIQYACADEACPHNNTSTCETSQGCINLVQDFKVLTPPERKTIQRKGCSPGACMPLAFSATLGNQQTFRYDQRCCQAEQCNQQDLPPQPSSQANGVQCPACSSDTALTCYPVPLQCTGAETECIDVIGTARSGHGSLPYMALYAKGCATRSACNLNMTVLETVHIRTFCTCGSTPLRVFSPVLASLFLLKVLF